MVDTSDAAGREHVLLNKLAKAKERKLTIAKLAPKKITKAYQAVGLADQSAAEAAVKELTAAGLVTQAKQGRSVWITLTETGSARLESLPAPTKPARKSVLNAKPPLPDVDENPNLVPHQQAFLLLQLLSADRRTMTEGKANDVLRTRVAKEDLELNNVLANQLRRKMAERGYLEAAKDGRSLHLTLTDCGLSYLVTLHHHPAATLGVTGKAINDLLEAARRTDGEARATHAASAADRQQDATTPSAAELGRIVYDTFRELARERYSRTGLVPIFAVRREIARKYGATAARQDTLNTPILQLRKDQKIILTSISDTRSASADELNESISDGYQTLFYMEEGDGQR